MTFKSTLGPLLLLLVAPRLWGTSCIPSPSREHHLDIAATPSFVEAASSSHRAEGTNAKRAAAVCFFGQVKNIQAEQAENFSENVLHPLLKLFQRIDIYVHTYNLQTFTNPRNGEDNVVIDVDKSLEVLVSHIMRAAPTNTVCIKQIKVSESCDADAKFRDVRYYLHPGDPWHNDGLSMRYFLRQLYSLDQVTRLWKGPQGNWFNGDDAKKLKRMYDAVIYTRPDLMFLNKLQITEDDIVHASACEQDTGRLFPGDNTIYTPTFDEWHGLNDRFAIGSPSVMQIYGHRMHMIESYFEKYPSLQLWAEPYLYKVMIEMFGVVHGRLDNFTFTRVRANGVFRLT